MAATADQTSTRLALIGVEACGCVTYANARPDHLDADDHKAIGKIIAAGGEMRRMTPDDARALPDFLPLRCPHDPKGWEREKPRKIEPHVKSFRRVGGRDISRVVFAGIKGWNRFDFGEVRKWDGSWWATDGWFNYRAPGAHNGMLTYDEAPKDDDRPTLHLGPFTKQRDAAEALLPYAVQYAASLTKRSSERRANTEASAPSHGKRA